MRIQGVHESPHEQTLGTWSKSTIIFLLSNPWDLEIKTKVFSQRNAQGLHSSSTQAALQPGQGRVEGRCQRAGQRYFSTGQPSALVRTFLADQLSPWLAQETFCRQLWLAQTMLAHPREGLLLLDEMEPSQRRNPLLARWPCIQEHNGVGPLSGF